MNDEEPPMPGRPFIPTDCKESIKMQATTRATRYTFFGHPVPDALVAKFPDRQTLFDNQYGTHVVRHRTQQYVGVPNRRGAVAA